MERPSKIHSFFVIDEKRASSKGFKINSDVFRSKNLTEVGLPYFRQKGRIYLRGFRNASFNPEAITSNSCTEK